ncbi:ABC transporter ATP-binding protein [Lachnospiraceae bacterium HCP28S3_F9]|uniref:ABC transporter ATP-binding protein n=1 Tax=Clostridium scindens (strain JCM 10418 / VPI 12708) TaxID=29347 RepID=A0A844FDD3_CLOSV|nr:ABC transporter ATP-binding protein [[Clostridium] scindens]MCI6535272.1 ABC transporter ATP-binding protein [Lachnospiraceae bacterium]MDY4561509.1 ABC transporter ATP-binding protein [Peptostreptococcus porci]MSS42055.1 ABC transporter ATP-binding protein [[Clostridium] scindens]
MIKLSDICKTYINKENSHDVLHHVNLEIQDGEFVIISGTSGSGKTTLLNILGLIDRATGGNYILNGENITDMNDNAHAELRNKMFGYVFQSFYLIDELNIVENVCVPAGYAGERKKERNKRAEELLKVVGLGDKVHSRPSQLSGGEKQRVAIARALINNPKIILADEPTGNLDSNNSRIVMELLKKKYIEGKTIIMVTHDPSLEIYATKIIHIVDGKIEEIKVNNTHLHE